MTRYNIVGSQGETQAGSDAEVLKNRLNITRVEDMDELELVLLQKLYVSVLQEHLPPGRISALHLKRWHRRWLGNVYDWAGQYRSVNMSKDGFPFAPATQLIRLMQIFDTEYLARYTPCTGMSADDLNDAIAITHVEFILMHPFREGNGRISRLLADVMAVQSGRQPLDYSAWEQNRVPYVRAIQAGMGGDYQPMRKWVAVALGE